MSDIHYEGHIHSGCEERSREWKPGDGYPLPPMEDSAYPSDAQPLPASESAASVADEHFFLEVRTRDGRLLSQWAIPVGEDASEVDVNAEIAWLRSPYRVIDQLPCDTNADALLRRSAAQGRDNATSTTTRRQS